MEQQLKELLKNKFYSLIAEGVEKFPFTKIDAKKLPLIQIPLNPSTKREERSCHHDLVTQISNCSLCPLSQSRKRVVVSSEIVKKKFFILSEFPDFEDEHSQSKLLYTEKSSSRLILKLLEKLGLVQNSHFSFALKCVPEKGIPKNALSLCTQNNLKNELKAVDPEIILCFGQKAILAIAQFDPNILLSELDENASQFTLNYENKTKTVLFLSSSRDLQTFPYWRNQVWRFLERYKAN